MKKLWNKAKPYLLWVAGLFVALWALRRYLRPSLPVSSKTTMQDEIEAINADETVQRAANKADGAKRLAQIKLDHSQASDWIEDHARDPFKDVAPTSDEELMHDIEDLQWMMSREDKC